MKNNILFSLSVLLLGSTLFAIQTKQDNNDDKYTLEYHADTKECSLQKNGKNIDLFDERLGDKAPRSAYTCTAMQKEHYNDCTRVKAENNVAQMIAFGALEKTNLTLAFKVPHKSVDATLEVTCTKQLPKKENK
ncbi:MAG: hypothetical protein J7J31_00235 [Helicobacteraceae bacterium]|nr:hypothetical protein [Helicobacteraceae bacterium]